VVDRSISAFQKTLLKELEYNVLVNIH